MVKANIIWASMFGGAEDVAKDVYEEVKDMGVEIHEMNDVSMEALQAMENIVFVSSSTGFGELPDETGMGAGGDKFYENLLESKLDLTNTKFAVCALGCRSHENFCGAGVKLLTQMEAHGAQCIAPMHECDGDDVGGREFTKAAIEKLIG